MKSGHVILILAILLLSGCTMQTGAAENAEETVLSVHITNYTCDVISRREINPEMGIVRVQASGDAAAIGTTDILLSMPSWAEEFDCGVWHKEPDTYAKTCIRMEGDPETTTWSASSGDIDITISETATEINALVVLNMIREELQARDLRTEVACIS